MAKQIDCPFCGSRGPSSAEHVWAQWLHETPGAIELLRSTHGERSARAHVEFEKNETGRWQSSSVSGGHWARWLPNVKVDVCQACNNGWMSELETKAKEILGPVMFGRESFVKVSADDLMALASWAAKSMMAYALTRPALHRGFTPDECRAMAEGQGPPARARIWMFYSSAEQAQVAMSVDTTLLTSEEGPPDLGSAPDNTLVGYLAAAGVAFYLLLSPPDAPEGMEEVLTHPVLLQAEGVRSIWPRQRAQFFPLADLPDRHVRLLLSDTGRMFGSLGLPTAGLTDEELVQARREFVEGDDVAVVRERWRPASDVPGEEGARR